MAEPELTRQVMVRVTLQTYDQLESVAKENERTISQTIRLAIKHYLGTDAEIDDPLHAPIEDLQQARVLNVIDAWLQANPEHPKAPEVRGVRAAWCALSPESRNGIMDGLVSRFGWR